MTDKLALIFLQRWRKNFYYDTKNHTLAFEKEQHFLSNL